MSIIWQRCMLILHKECVPACGLGNEVRRPAIPVVRDFEGVFDDPRPDQVVFSNQETVTLTVFEEKTIEAGIGTAVGDFDPSVLGEVVAAPFETNEDDVLPVGATHELLDPLRCDVYLEAYLGEYDPVGPTEHYFVRKMAYNSAATDLLNEAIGAIQRQGARELPEFARLVGEAGSAIHDAVLAGTMSQESLDRCEKRLRLHSREFHRALSKLEELQARRKTVEAGMRGVPSNPFTTEAACELHLLKRFQTGKCCCPRCGARKGHSIISRRCWECAVCKSQTGLRHGTIMSNSPMPLVKWFAAIWLIFARSKITTTELMSALRVNRIMTVRKMANKIRAAMMEENASDLLAGLDNYYATCQAALPESSARQSTTLTVKEDASR